MRRCLVPFFLGVFEAGLEPDGVDFDVVLPAALAADRRGHDVDRIIEINCEIRDFVKTTLGAGTAALVLSGDCLSAIGCMAGAVQSGADPFLLWFDAHGDFHTHETTISGHLGGMPLAMISGRGHQDIIRHTGLMPLPDERICHVGGRDLEPAEREAFRNSEVRTVTTLAEALPHVPSESSIWIHFDTDYITPRDAPAMRYPALGGPSAVEVQADFSILVRRFNVLGVSVSGWAPHLDIAGSERSTKQVCWRTVSAFDNA